MNSGLPSADVAIRARVLAGELEIAAEHVDQLVGLPLRERLQDDRGDVRPSAGQPGTLVHELGPAETDEDDR